MKGGTAGFAPNVLLDLTLLLPTAGEFQVQNFTSLLTNFDHNFGDSAGGQVFDYVQIHSTASTVESKVYLLCESLFRPNQLPAGYFC